MGHRRFAPPVRGKQNDAKKFNDDLTLHFFNTWNFLDLKSIFGGFYGKQSLCKGFGKCFCLTGNELAMECMTDCRSLIKEAMKVVCDLHSHDGDFLASQDPLFSTLLRPRLPFEV